MKDLKDYRGREQSMWVIANVLVFLITHNFISVNTSELIETANTLSELFTAVILTVIAFGFIFVVECLFSTELKSKLLYLFGLFSLPGCTIFTNIKNKNRDKRFSYNSLVEKYPTIFENLPRDKKARKRYENEHWYSIYNQHRNESIIHFSNRDSLMCRDVYISTLTMLVLYIAVSVAELVTFNCGYLMFLTLLVITTNIGANRKANRFAYNVIAYDVNYKLKEKKE
ncbi:MAG: hypothetical protein FWF76_01395 [Oscillospiraceae bacterium]|nr:hypothetical protein [Oscillospiraceae bacterium]